MAAATIFDHPWILVIVAAITLVRWLIQKGKGEAQNTQPPTPSQPITRGGETQSEEERIRKFLEALGQAGRDNAAQGRAAPPAD